MAQQLLSGEAFAPVWPPGLPGYLSLCYRVLGAHQVVAMGSMLVWYAAFAVLFYLLCARVAGRRAGGIALAVFAVWPTAIYHSVFPLTQLPVATLLVAAALALLELRRRRRLWPAAFAGAVLGYCTLVRPSTGLLTAATPLALAWRQRGLRLAAPIMLITSVALMVPWFVRAESMTGRFVPINYASSRNLYLGNNEWTPLYKTWWFGSHLGEGLVPDEFAEVEARMEELPLHERDGAYRALALEHIADHPGTFVVRTVNRIRVYFSFDTYTGTVLTRYYGLPTLIGLGVILADAIIYMGIMLGAIAGLFLRTTLDLNRRELLTLVLIALGYAAPYWFSFAHPTYHLPVMPLFLVPAAALAAWRPPTGRRGVGRREAIAALAQRRAFLVCVVVFLYAQLEWACVMAVGLLGR